MTVAGHHHGTMVVMAGTAHGTTRGTVLGMTRGMIPGTGGMVRIIASDITVGTIGAGVGTIIPDGISGGTTDGTAGITAIGLAEVSSTAAIVALRQVAAM